MPLGGFLGGAIIWGRLSPHSPHHLSLLLLLLGSDVCILPDQGVEACMKQRITTSKSICKKKNKKQHTNCSEIMNFNVKGMKGDYENSSQIVPYYPMQTCRSAVKPSLKFSRTHFSLKLYEVYFITRWTLFSECWCNGLLKNIPFTYQLLFMGTGTHSSYCLSYLLLSLSGNCYFPVNPVH